MTPILSIVIANYNYGRFLEEAIRSVLSQIGEGKNQVHPGEVELIIIDGGSTDNSVDVIKKYANGLPPDQLSSKLYPLSSSVSYWISEPDKGQSNAFNKGFAKARGKYLTWLNADDIMPFGALWNVARALKAYPKCDWFTGNFYRFTENGLVIEIGWGPHWYPMILQRKSSPLVIFGPTTFFSKRIYEAVGRIDESLHYIMDNDLWYRFIMAGVKQRRINAFCWGFRMHKASKTAEFDEHVLSPEIRAKMHEELLYVAKKTGYHFSKAMRGLLLLLRVFDGSFVVKLWLKKIFKKVSTT